MQVSTLNEFAKGLIDRLPEMELSGEALSGYRWLKNVHLLQMVLFLCFVACCFATPQWFFPRTQSSSFAVTSSDPSLSTQQFLQVLADSQPELAQAYLEQQRNKRITYAILGGRIVCILAIALLALVTRAKIGSDKCALIACGIRKYRAERNGEILLLTRK